MNDEILRLKCITPMQKLILLKIDMYTEVLKKFMGGYNITCTDLAKQLGVTRTIMLKEFDKLKELDYITSEVKDRARTTNFTQKFKDLISIKNSSN